MTAMVSFFEFVDLERLQLVPASRANASRMKVVLRMISFFEPGSSDADIITEQTEKRGKFWSAPAERSGDDWSASVPLAGLRLVSRSNASGTLALQSTVVAS